MASQDFLRGLFLVALSLVFGLNALRYGFGSFAHAGPGLFPVLVSGILAMLGVVTVVQSFVRTSPPFQFSFANIALIMAAIGGFIVLSKFVSMILGIVALVFIASLAANAFSWTRSLLLSLALIAIAFAFQRFLGLNLQLV